MSRFESALGLEDAESIFPWQEKLLLRLLGDFGHRLSLDVPTGLGKTSVIAAWLTALAKGASLPRRLVYVVDRRAVVDQATREAERLRAWIAMEPSVRNAIGVEEGEQLPISTLRGQFADNGQWLGDPSGPSIVVGTVDMVGSRLLFEGYGVSRKMRPYHAGLLGVDSLFVVDESHLVPPFEALLERVVEPATELRGTADCEDAIPRSVLLTLSATGRAISGDFVRIDETDLAHRIAGKRLRATKRLSLVEPQNDDSLVKRLSDTAWRLSKEATASKRIIVFCNSRDHAMKVDQEINKLANGDKKQDIPKREIATQLFVGARRVRERQNVERWLEDHGFLAGAESQVSIPSFVFSTSAGEVGVDLDADHMVGDLVAYERMVQRFGRVNRRGNGEAEIHVLLECDKPDAKEKAALKKATAKSKRQRNATEHQLVRKFSDAPKYRAALEALPTVAGTDSRDASPEALRQLKIRAESDESLAEVLSDATTNTPLRPELTRPILDSWSLTSLDKHTASPFVSPWLRGWVNDEPQTTIVWRKYLPTVSHQCSQRQIEEFFEAAPVHLTEKLETDSDSVFKWLLKRVEIIDKLRSKPPKSKSQEEIDSLPKNHEFVAVVLNRKGEFREALRLSQLRFDNKAAKATIARLLFNATLVVDSRIGGLSISEGSAGLLDPTAPATSQADAADAMEPSDWIKPSGTQSQRVAPIPGFRVILHSLSDSETESPDMDLNDWKECFRMPVVTVDEDEPSNVLIVKKYRRTATSEESRSTIGEKGLKSHLLETEAEVNRLTVRLELPDDLRLVFAIAARNHDCGKDCERWQNAFSAPEKGRPYAKTRGPFRNNLLDGYRHEFGSLPHVEKDPDFAGLSDEHRDLALHLVAAHHGFARPGIRTDSCDDAPPSALSERARDVALRFARLQNRWGPWGLAWLESILRAADHRASALVDNEPATNDKLDSVQEAPHG